MCDMCPCHPDNGQFVYALLAAAALLAGVGLMRKHWAKMIACDFHRTMRCYSCLIIEESSKQVIEQDFAGEIASGLFEYRAVNTDAPENRHFEDDYNLSVQSLVLVRGENGVVTKWTNLEKVWDLFEDYGAFAEYVQGKVTRYLYPDDIPAEAGTSEN